MIKVALVDDNSFLRHTILEKLQFFEDISCKFVAENGKDLLTKIDKNTTVQLILMDIEMPYMNGIDATAEIKRLYPHIKVIMLTVFDNDENIFRAIKAGSDGYLLKEITPDELYKAINDTMNGGASMTPSIALKTLKMFRQPIDFEFETEQINQDLKLTDREINVLEQLATGIKYDQIATNLFVSTGTIRKHVENIYFKLRVHNKLEAIQKAKTNRLI
jgi:DNA-binding NarL/FixJ family response regulator